MLIIDESSQIIVTDFIARICINECYQEIDNIVVFGDSQQLSPRLINYQQYGEKDLMFENYCNKLEVPLQSIIR